MYTVLVSVWVQSRIGTTQWVKFNIKNYQVLIKEWLEGNCVWYSRAKGEYPKKDKLRRVPPPQGWFRSYWRRCNSAHWIAEKLAGLSWPQPFCSLLWSAGDQEPMGWACRENGNQGTGVLCLGLQWEGGRYWEGGVSCKVSSDSGYQCEQKSLGSVSTLRGLLRSLSPGQAKAARLLTPLYSSRK